MAIFKHEIHNKSYQNLYYQNKNYTPLTNGHGAMHATGLYYNLAIVIYIYWHTLKYPEKNEQKLSVVAAYHGLGKSLRTKPSIFMQSKHGRVINYGSFAIMPQIC